MNSQIVINDPAQSGKFKFAGFDSAEVQRTVTGSITISDYVHAYVVRDPSDGAIYVKPNAAVYPVTPGSSLSLNLQINAKDAAGNSLPPMQIDITLNGPALPPNATHVKVTEGPDVAGFSVPADPGSDTITF